MSSAVTLVQPPQPPLHAAPKRSSGRSCGPPKKLGIYVSKKRRKPSSSKEKKKMSFTPAPSENDSLESGSKLSDVAILLIVIGCLLFMCIAFICLVSLLKIIRNQRYTRMSVESIENNH